MKESLLWDTAKSFLWCVAFILFLFFVLFADKSQSALYDEEAEQFLHQGCISMIDAQNKMLNRMPATNMIDLRDKGIEHLVVWMKKYWNPEFNIDEAWLFQSRASSDVVVGFGLDGCATGQRSFHPMDLVRILNGRDVIE